MPRGMLLDGRQKLGELALALYFDHDHPANFVISMKAVGSAWPSCPPVKGCPVVSTCTRSDVHQPPQQQRQQ